MFRGRATVLVSKVLASRTAQVVGHFAQDSIVTMSLVGTLTVFHYAMRYTPARAEFIATFTTVHEYVVLGSYGLLALKSLLRLARL
jgi:hypothetical protein